MRDRADTAVHESVHSCVAIELGRTVRWARLEVRPVDGRSDIAQHGAVSIDRDELDLDELDVRDLIISLAPGLHEGSGIAFSCGAGDFGAWPPLFEALALPGEGDRRQVSALVRLLGLSESDYEEAIELARELLDNPSMQAWIARTTSRLQRTGYLDGESIAALRPTTRTKEAVPA